MNNEDWYALDTNWIDSNLPDEDCYDSNSYESIKSKLENFMKRFTEIWVDSGKKEVKNSCCHYLNRFKKTVNRFTVNLFRKTVNRFTAILFRKIWLDSKGVTQGKWTKGMLDMNHESNQVIHGRIFHIWQHTRQQGITRHNET